MWIMLLVGPLEVEQSSQLNLCWEDQSDHKMFSAWPHTWWGFCSPSPVSTDFFFACLMPSLYSCFDGAPLSTDRKAALLALDTALIAPSILLFGEWSYCLCDHQVINTFISLCTQNSPIGMLQLHLSTLQQNFRQIATWAFFFVNVYESNLHVEA